MDPTLTVQKSQSKPLRTLWLCSWFPHDKDPFDGDFILRHAIAASKYQYIDVLHIVQNIYFLNNQSRVYNKAYNQQLYAKIIYPPFYGWLPAFLSKLLFNIHYFQLLKKEINNYISQVGMPDLVHVHIPVKLGWGARLIKRKWKIPYIVSEHSSGYERGVPDGYFNRGFFYRYQTRATYKEADLVLSVSHWLSKKLTEIFHIPLTKVLPNAVDTDLFFPYSQKKNEKARLIHVSMMQSLKNVVGILDALALLRQERSDWEMIFVGPADQRLIEYAYKKDLNGFVYWKGLLTHEEVAHEMQLSSAYVHFSFYENLPCVIQEALCSGLYIISSNVGGITEIINEQNGVLVNRGDIEALKKAILSFLDGKQKFQNIELAEALRNQWNYEQIAHAFESIYNSVLSSRSH